MHRTRRPFRVITSVVFTLAAKAYLALLHYAAHSRIFSCLNILYLRVEKKIHYTPHTPLG